jgi:hypothetical protein
LKPLSTRNIISMHTLAHEILSQLSVSRVGAPTVSNDASQGYILGMKWYDSSATPPNCYECVSTAVGAAVWLASNNPGAAASSTNAAVVSIQPVVIKVDVTSTLLAAIGAATSGNATLLSIPAGYKILSCDVVQAAADTHFAGPSISALTISVGNAGTVTKYCAATDVFTAGQNQTIGTVAGIESWTAPVNLIVHAIATGANLSVLTAGVAHVYVTLVNLNLAK